MRCLGAPSQSSQGDRQARGKSDIQLRVQLLTQGDDFSGCSGLIRPILVATLEMGTGGGLHDEGGEQAFFLARLFEIGSEEDAESLVDGVGVAKALLYEFKDRPQCRAGTTFDGAHATGGKVERRPCA